MQTFILVVFLRGRYKQWTRGPRTPGPTGVQLFLEVYTLYNLYYVPLLVVSHSQSTFCPHDASHDVYQLEIISASEKVVHL